MSRIPPHGSVKRSFAATLNNPDSAYVAKLPETELQTATRALLAGTIMSEFHLKISKKKKVHIKLESDARPTQSERRVTPAPPSPSDGGGRTILPMGGRARYVCTKMCIHI